MVLKVVELEKTVCRHPSAESFYRRLPARASCTICAIISILEAPPLLLLPPLLSEDGQGMGTTLL
jgi:hypothetical protein